MNLFSIEIVNMNIFKNYLTIFLILSEIFLINYCHPQKSVTINKSIRLNGDISTIAVINFQNSGDKNSEQLSIALTNFLISDLSEEPGFKILERKELQKLLSEVKLQISGLVDKNTAIQAGKMIGAHYLVLGSVISVKDRLLINARLVYVETTEILLSRSVNGNEKEGLELVEKLSEKLAKAIRTSI